MFSKLQSLLGHLLLTALVVAVVIATDHLFQWFRPGYQAAPNDRALAILALIFFFLLAIRRHAVVAVLLALMVLMQLAQLLHFTYFGTLIPPQSVALLLPEIGEIADSLGGLAGELLLPLGLVVFELLLLALLLRRLDGVRLRMPFAWVPLALLLSITPLKANNPKYGAQRFYPNPDDYALINTLESVSYFIGRDLPRIARGEAPKGISCGPYRQHDEAAASPRNIVVVMGESLGTSHMGLFGYGRPTTPRLQALSATPGFFRTTADSAAVATKVTLPMFFNVLREPQNLLQVVRYDTNLLKMAREQGYRTHYLSVQTRTLSTYAGTEHADVVMAKEDWDDFATERDRVLVDALRAIDLSQRNFIVLHQRNSHSPYQESYPEGYGRYPTNLDDGLINRVNAYDNSVLFTDEVLADLIGHLRREATGGSVLLFTSDHGELLGEDGRWGHAQLDVDMARVPVLIDAQGVDPVLQRRIESLGHTSHYELGKLVAAMLGRRVENPNEIPGVTFVNGPDLTGAAGFLVVDRRGEAGRYTTSFDLPPGEAEALQCASAPLEATQPMAGGSSPTG